MARERLTVQGNRVVAVGTRDPQEEQFVLAQMVVEYFGDGEIPACLSGDIALRNAARAVLARRGTETT